MAEADMQGANLLIRSNLGFGILLNEASTCSRRCKNVISHHHLKSYSRNSFFVFTLCCDCEVSVVLNENKHDKLQIQKLYEYKAVLMYSNSLLSCKYTHHKSKLNLIFILMIFKVSRETEKTNE